MTCPSRWVTARSSACSARTAPARPPPSACWPGSSRRPPGTAIVNGHPLGDDDAADPRLHRHPDREPRPAREADRPPEPGLLRAPVRAERRAAARRGGPIPGRGRDERARRSTGRRLQQGDAPEDRHRPRAPPRAGGDLPRRADQRPRPLGRQDGPRLHRHARERSAARSWSAPTTWTRPSGSAIGSGSCAARCCASTLPPGCAARDAPPRSASSSTARAGRSRSSVAWRTSPYVNGVQAKENTLVVELADPPHETPDLVAELVGAGARITSVVEDAPDPGGGVPRPGRRGRRAGHGPMRRATSGPSSPRSGATC